MDLGQYARPGVWAPLTVAIGIGIYFIIAVDGETPAVEETPLGRLDTALTIFAADASAPVESPLILEAGQSLRIRLRFGFPPSEVRQVRLFYGDPEAPSDLVASVPEGAGTAGVWAARFGGDAHQPAPRLTLTSDGFHITLAAAFVLAVGEMTNLRAMVSNRGLTQEDAIALANRPYTPDRTLRVALSDPISVHAPDDAEATDPVE